MKLYTEEELLKAIQYGRDYYDGWVMTEPEILKLLTPIELPSDEEIEKEIESHEHITLELGAGFRAGAKMVIYKILNQNK